MRKARRAVVEKRRLERNAIANILQMLAGAGLLFALYRYINTTLGVEQLGVWSVVLATVSASRLADLGLAAGVTRFVARDLARGDPNRAAQVIDTATLTVMVSAGALLPLLYPLIAKLLPHLFDGKYLPQALEILPYALVSLGLTIVGAVYQSGLDGCQRMDLRAGLVVTGQALLLALALWLLPRQGLVGLAWAQLGQGVFLIVSGRLLLGRVLPRLRPLPQCWHKPVLREMIGYGTNVQAATLFMLLFDPITKALMARFGGATAAGYFEVANQVVLQMRAVIATANQAIVPHVAELAETKPFHLSGLYRDNLRALILVTLPAFALLFAWAGGISWLLIGEYRPELVLLLHLCTFAWGFNTFASPAYFCNLGTGRLGWNTVSHLTVGCLNPALGWLLGSHYGAEGVACAYVIALVAGSLLLIVVFQSRNQLGISGWFAREHLQLLAACAAVGALDWFKPAWLAAYNPAALMVGLLLPPFALFLATWLNPTRRELWGRLKNWRTMA